MLRRQAPGSAGSPSAGLPADQPLVDRVPLPPRVLGQVGLVHPVPLDDRGLDQRGRGLRVELEQLRGAAGAVVPEVEAAVDARRVVRRLHRQPHVRVLVVVRPRLRVAVEPGPDDLLVGELGDADLGQEARLRVADRGEVALPAALHGVPRALLDHPVAGLEAHRVQRGGGRLQLLDLGLGEVVVRPLLPVRDHRPVGQFGVVVGQPEAVVGQPPAVADRAVGKSAHASAAGLARTTCRCRRRPCRPRWS